MRIKTVFLLISMFWSSILFSQKQIAVGDKAPEIYVSDYIENIPSDKSVTGKYILLEFWTTWCAPCLGAVPHLNNLKEKYNERQDIVFLSMTYEEPEKVMRTLKRVPFKTCVVTDQTKATLKNFGVEIDNSITVPRTILIDNKGIVKWIGNPYHLTDSIFNGFVNDKYNQQPIIENTPTTVQTPTVAPNTIEAATQLLKDKQTKFCFSLIEVKTTPINQWSAKLPILGKYLDVNNSLTSILSELCGVPKTQISVPDSIKNNVYCLFYKNNQMIESDAFLLDIKLNLLKALNLKEKIVRQTTDIYQLTLSDKNKLDISKEQNEQTHSGSNNTHLTFSNIELESAIKIISEFHNIIIVDNTNLSAKYNFLFQKGSLEDLVKDFESYGLLLKKAKKKMTFYQFE